MHGRTIASLPRGQSADELSFERALELLAAKAEKDKAKGKGQKATKPAKKKPAKKAKRAKKAKKAAN